MLIYSFATHLLGAGKDLRFIHMCPEHASTRTTEVYTHPETGAFKPIKNPLDC